MDDHETKWQTRKKSHHHPWHVRSLSPEPPLEQFEQLEVPLEAQREEEEAGTNTTTAPAKRLTAQDSSAAFLGRSRLLEPLVSVGVATVPVVCGLWSQKPSRCLPVLQFLRRRPITGVAGSPDKGGSHNGGTTALIPGKPERAPITRSLLYNCSMLMDKISPSYVTPIFNCNSKPPNIPFFPFLTPLIRARQRSAPQIHVRPWAGSPERPPSRILREVPFFLNNVMLMLPIMPSGVSRSLGEDVRPRLCVSLLIHSSIHPSQNNMPFPSSHRLHPMPPPTSAHLSHLAIVFVGDQGYPSPRQSSWSRSITSRNRTGVVPHRAVRTLRPCLGFFWRRPLFCLVGFRPDCFLSMFVEPRLSRRRCFSPSSVPLLVPRSSSSQRNTSMSNRPLSIPMTAFPSENQVRNQCSSS